MFEDSINYLKEEDGHLTKEADKMKKIIENLESKQKGMSKKITEMENDIVGQDRRYDN